ncbi:hypothetical protein PARMER_03773 [Parabacteroides merdae ATCC 43184]|nr:hypothetical protein PARMER_03773 [Parabacteroides merdae ATCC 43184]
MSFIFRINITKEDEALLGKGDQYCLSPHLQRHRQFDPTF